MKSFWFEKPFKYDGSQLHSLFAYLELGLLGDSIVAWRGPCDVSLDKMVDGEDFREKQKICGSDMVHFIIEKFPANLHSAVAMQRVLASIVKDIVEEQAPAVRLVRDGDDLYWGKITPRKFSISIATVSPTSSLIHYAVNVANEGTPVPTCALEDFSIEPQDFANEVLKRFSLEAASIEAATQKVFWVK
jgi:uncharacterized protein